MKRVLITGGAGYIGSHVVKALGERGFTVLVYDNLSNGHRDAVHYGELVVGDLADTALLDSTIERFRPDAVMHFAAFIVAQESMREPLRYYQNNAVNAVSLLASMEKYEVNQFIFSSTAAVYGYPDATPVSEEAPVRPIHPYGQAKAFVEQVLRDTSSTSGLRFVSLRYFNAAGADPHGRLGERHEPESHLIPLILQAAAGRRNCISIFGTDYPTSDGTCVRDYVHVSDLADAHLLALRYLADGGASDIFNCGYGHGYSVLEVIDAARRVTAVDIPEERAPRRPEDPPSLVGDGAKLHRKLGWKPRHDDLEFIIRTAWDWDRKQRFVADS